MLDNRESEQDRDDLQRKPPGRRIPFGFWRPVNPDDPDQSPTDEQFEEQFQAFLDFLKVREAEVKAGTERPVERLVMLGDQIDPVRGREFKTSYAVPLSEPVPLAREERDDERDCDAGHMYRGRDGE